MIVSGKRDRHPTTSDSRVVQAILRYTAEGSTMRNDMQIGPISLDSAFLDAMPITKGEPCFGIYAAYSARCERWGADSSPPGTPMSNPPSTTATSRTPGTGSACVRRYAWPSAFLTPCASEPSSRADLHHRR